MDASFIEEVTARVEIGQSHASIAAELQHRFPERRGFSLRSVQRFCSDWGIVKRNVFHGNVNDELRFGLCSQSADKRVGDTHMVGE